MESAEYYFRKGNEKFNSRRFEEAISDYDKAIALNPGFLEAYSNRGLAKARLGQYKEAIADYDIAIILNPDFAELYFNRGMAKAESGQYEEAIADYDKAVQLNPSHSNAHNNRGLVKAEMGQYEEAITDYDKAITLNPDFTQSYINRGALKAELGQYEEAIADYDKAVQLNPDFAATYYNRGVLKAELGQYEEAVTDYDEAVNLYPDFAAAYSNRGLAKAKLGQNEKAIADYDIAINLYPDFAAAYSNRGMAKAESGQYEEAIADYDKAVQLNPYFAATYSNRGLAKARLGQNEKAIADYDIAIKLNPYLDLAYINRGLSYADMSNWPEAQRNFVRFVRLTDLQELATRLPPLITVFRERCYVPYLIKAIFQRLPWVNNLWSYQSVLEENNVKCNGFDLYLDYLAYKKHPEINPRGFYQLKAFIHYYMGDAIEAFSIFDSISDYGNRQLLSLTEHYYYLKAAHESLEPAESQKSILQGALTRAGQYAERFKKGEAHDSVELYYAGQFFYLNRSWTEAQDCFERSNHFLPAAYMQVLTLSELNQPAARTAKIAEIRSRESQLTREQGFLKGFQPQELRGSPTQDLALLRRYAYYTEISQAISAVRQATDPAFRHREFAKSYTINLSANEKDKVIVYRRERKQKFLQQAIEDQLAQWLQESERASLTQVLPTEMEELMEEVQQTFQAMEAVARTGGDMEKALVRVIASWKFTVYSNCEKLYTKLIVYYHLKQKLTLQQTLYLLYFVVFIRQVRLLYLEGNSAKALETLKAGGLEGFTDTSKEAVKMLFAPELVLILPVMAAFTACFFSSLVVKIGLNVALRWLTSFRQERKINPNAFQPYLEFKKALEEDIGHLLQFGPNDFLDELTLSEYEAIHRKLEDLAA